MLKFILELILLELYDIVFTKIRIRCYLHGRNVPENVIHW